MEAPVPSPVRYRSHHHPEFALQLLQGREGEVAKAVGVVQGGNV